MKLQAKTASSDLFFLIDKDQYLFLKKQDLSCLYKKSQTQKREPTTKVKVFWNSFQANGSKLQKNSVPSGYFTTSFEIAEGKVCGEEVKGGYYEEVLRRLGKKENLKDRIRLVYLGPAGDRLIIVSKFYDGYKNIKACQENLCKALGWKCTKGCNNLNRDYPFPLEELTLFEDGRIWTENDDENGGFIRSAEYKLEYDKESNIEYIGQKTNWISFPAIVDMLETRQEADLMKESYDYGNGVINAESEEYERLKADAEDYRNDLLSDDHIPEVWPFPLNLIADIAPYNFIRPILIAGCFEVVTMLNAYRGVKTLMFRRKDRKNKGQMVEKPVESPVPNGLFMVVEAPTGNGKKQITEFHSMMWSEHRKEDDAVYAGENAYNEKATITGDSKNKDKQEWKKITMLSDETSYSKLIERIAHNGERMMVCHCSELHTLFSSLANGGDAKQVSTKFSSFLRKIYDQEDFSQDYKTYNSVRGFHRGAINYLTCGTPGARFDTFKSYEDGLANRIWFVSLNKDNGMGEPVWDVMTEEEELRFSEFQKWAIQSRNEVEESGEFFKIEGSEFVYDVLIEWENEVKRIADETLDETARTFVHRARNNVNAVGCTLYLLFKRYHKEMSERKIKAAVKKIVLWLAELRLQESCFRYDVNTDYKLTDAAPKINVFNELGDEFFLSELAAKMSAAKMRTPANLTVNVWISRGKVKLVSTDEEKAKGIKRFRKVEQSSKLGVRS